MYHMQAVLLNLRITIRRNTIYLRNSQTSFQLGQYKVKNSRVQAIIFGHCRESGTARKAYKRSALENLFLQGIVSNVLKEIWSSAQGIQSILIGFYGCYDKGLEEAKWNSLCWRYCALRGIVLFQYWIKPNTVRYEATVDLPCIRCLVSREPFLTLNVADI